MRDGDEGHVRSSVGERLRNGRFAPGGSRCPPPGCRSAAPEGWCLPAGWSILAGGRRCPAPGCRSAPGAGWSILTLREWVLTGPQRSVTGRGAGAPKGARSRPSCWKGIGTRTARMGPASAEVSIGDWLEFASWSSEPASGQPPPGSHVDCAVGPPPFSGGAIVPPNSGALVTRYGSPERVAVPAVQAGCSGFRRRGREQQDTGPGQGRAGGVGLPMATDVASSVVWVASMLPAAFTNSPFVMVGELTEEPLSV